MKKLSSGLLMAAAVVFLLGILGCKDSPSSEREIISFVVKDSDGKDRNASISDATSQITVSLLAGANVTALAPTIKISPEAKISPASGEAVDFSIPITYNVTAENGLIRQYTVTVTAGPVLSFIQATAFPSKTVYEVGEQFNPNGLVVKATYTDGSVQEVFDYTLSVVDTSTPGPKTVTVSEGGKTTAFIILVRDPVVLQGITVTSFPYTMLYNLGSMFDSEGLVVKGIYSDGSFKEEVNYTLAGFSSATIGEKTITVALRGTTFTTTFAVRVTDPNTIVNKIAVTTPPTKTVYNEDEELDLSGIVVTGYLTDGSSAIIGYRSNPDNTNLRYWSYTASDYNKQKFGAQTITVTYAGYGSRIFDTFDVTVTPVERELNLTIGLLGEGHEAAFFGFPKAGKAADLAVERDVDFVLSWTGQPDGYDLTLPTQIILGVNTSDYTSISWSVDGGSLGNYNIITFKAKDYTLERVHTITFIGNGTYGYSKTLSFIVVK